METPLERVLPFLPPEMFFRSFAICSNNMRRTTFRVWIHDAVQHLAEKAANVTWPIMFSDLWAMDTHVDSAQAAAIYMYMFSQNAIDAANQSDAMLIKMARAACRTVVTRCVGREVGFHSMSNFNARLHEIFDEQFVIEDDQVFSKMFNAFRQDVRRFRIPNAFRSHQMARRRHPLQARNRIQVDTPDVHVHVSGRDEGEGEVQSSHSAADWLDQGFPAASGHVGGRDEGEGEVQSSHSPIHGDHINNPADWLDQGLLEKFRGRHPAFITQEGFLDVNDLSSYTPAVCASGFPAYLVCVGGVPTIQMMIALMC